MDAVTCAKHGKPCMVKTGTRPGPSHGKSFYICSNMQDRCDFAKEARHVEAKQCPEHSVMVELRMPHIHQKSQEQRTFYRCSKGKEEKKNWCGHWIQEKTSGPLQSKDPNTLSSSNHGASNEGRKNEGAKPKESLSKESPKPRESSKESSNLKESTKPKESSKESPKPKESSKHRKSHESSASKTTPKAQGKISSKQEPCTTTTPSFAGLRQQNETMEALGNLSLSSLTSKKSSSAARMTSTPVAAPHLLSRVKATEEWRDSSGYVHSDDEDDGDSDGVVSKSKKHLSSKSSAGRDSKPRKVDSSSSSDSSSASGSPVLKRGTDEKKSGKKSAQKYTTGLSSSDDSEDSPVKPSMKTEKSPVMPSKKSEKYATVLSSTDDSEDDSSVTHSKKIKNTARNLSSSDDSEDESPVRHSKKAEKAAPRPSSSKSDSSVKTSIKSEKYTTLLSSSEDSVDDSPVKPSKKSDVKSKGSSKDTAIQLSSSGSEDDELDATHKSTQLEAKQPDVTYRKLPSGQLIRVVKKSPQKEMKTETEKDKSQQQKNDTGDKVAELKEKQSYNLPPSSTGTLRGDIAKLNETRTHYEKHKQILARVNVQALPDGGVKLIQLIRDAKKKVEELTAAVTANRYPVPKPSEAIQGQGQGDGQGQGRVNVAGQAIGGAVRQTKITEHALPQHVYQQMYAANPQMNSLYGGRMTKARLAEVGTVTSEAIDRLHKQMESMPGKEEEVEDPQHLKVTLMSHQRQALRWLSWRENQHPPGGILADDMGLGKTLTMISLILHQKQLHQDKLDKSKSKAKGKSKSKSKKKYEDDSDFTSDDDDNDDDEWLSKDKDVAASGSAAGDGGFITSSATLIVCPASLVHQWAGEIERRVSAGVLKVVLYHGPTRDRSIAALSGADVVLTTYNLISKEVGVPEDLKKNKSSQDMPSSDLVTVSRSDSPLLRIGWHRIILDEAHAIKNHRSLGALAVGRLRAGRRWALTGTPLHNDLRDIYSLLRFLRASPFDEHRVWQRQVDNKSEKGQRRLNMLIKTLLLRRTKDQTSTITGKPLVDLPSKTAETHNIKLSDSERAVYDRIFQQSRKTMAAYLQKHEDKHFDKEVGGAGGGSVSTNPWAKDNPLQLPPGFQQGFQPASQVASQAPSIFHQKPASAVPGKRDNSASQMLLLLLRLRQCCSHLSLMREAVDTDALQEDGLDLDLAQQLADMSLKPQTELDEPDIKDKVKDMFENTADSSKICAVMKHLLEIRDKNKKSSDTPMKSVVVSQWTRMLDVVELHLKEEGVRCATIKGSVPAKERAQLVESFNTDPKGPQVMLISLRAGGVGLNLIGGNHLFLIDMHWNPALEQQACDRIYRMGQKREVFIHRFICQDTVEEKILQLQKKKMDLASNVLAGTRVTANKLSLEDLRMLFGLDTPAATAATAHPHQAAGFQHQRHF